MKQNDFFKQSKVLISRYLKIFFNDKQNLLLIMAIPLMTIIIVCIVASDNMFALESDNTINDGYPILSWESVDYEQPKKDSEDEDSEDEEYTTESLCKTWDGEIPQTPQMMPADSNKTTYYISSPGDLQFIATAKGEWMRKIYYLSNDIDMNGNEIIPIGTADEPFVGIFEGNGHIIKNFKINADSNCIGIFGCIYGEEAKIRNLGVEEGYIVGNSSAQNVGLIAGAVYDSTIDNCFTINSKINAKAGYVGGIAGVLSGKNDSALISNCYSRADITVRGEYIGGIAGAVESGGVQYTYYAGELLADNPDDFECVGSVIGMLNDDKNSFYDVYDNELLCEYDAIGYSDGDTENEEQVIVGWSTEKLQNNASLIRDSEDDAGEINGTFKNDGELAEFAGTQTGLFMLSCVAIFVGICNSVQEICKERNILKREYMTNLRLSSYITSKLVVQGLVCAVQNIIMLLIFYLSVSNKVFPSEGIILGSSKIETFITMFLLTYASDTIALLISSIVKNSSTANTFIPIILIVQIVFSGVLFNLGDAMDKIANLMISKWGIAALAATNHLNESQPKMLLSNPELSLQLGDSLSRVKDLYVATPANLLKIWIILIMFIVVCATLSCFMLRRVKNDRR